MRELSCHCCHVVRRGETVLLILALFSFTSFAQCRNILVFKSTITFLNFVFTPLCATHLLKYIIVQSLQMAQRLTTFFLNFAVIHTSPSMHLYAQHVLVSTLSCFLLYIINTWLWHTVHHISSANHLHNI